jgi:hypothetical protein
MAVKTPWALPLLTVGLLARDPVLVDFTRLQLDPHYWSEGAAIGDLNRDGRPDVVSGPYWWAGPDFRERREFYPPARTTTVKDPEGRSRTFPGYEGALGLKNAYSTDNFFAFVHDFDGDGWNDVLTYGLPHTPAYLYLNPRERGGHWPRHTVLNEVDNESPTLADLDGDGRPEMVCVNGGNFGYARPDPSDPTRPWPFRPITRAGNWQRFTHGLGVGDVNGDGRLDVLFKDGWLEQPRDLAGDPEWRWHRIPFAPAAAQLFAYDVNGDGRADVITALAAHGFGLAWHEQLAERDAQGSPLFRPHIFMNQRPDENRHGVTFSELHAVELADVDGDGLKDIITGKCFWAHGPSGSPDGDAPAVLYWFRLQRGPGGQVDWVPQRIDADSGVGRQIALGDVNGDGLPDVAIGNKKGTFLFRSQSRPVDRATWERAQPAVLYPGAVRHELRAADLVVHTRRSAEVAQARSAAVENPARPGAGEAPRDGRGEPLDTGFERGDLRGWTAVGAAFERQPVTGDAVFARRAPMRSGHVGRHWVGSYEDGRGDGATGTLTSQPFRISHSRASCLLAAGAYESLRLELIAAGTGEVLLRVSGAELRRKVPGNTETMQPVILDLSALRGREVALRLVDEQAGGAWGHLNFDDFLLYAEDAALPAGPVFTSGPR